MRTHEEVEDFVEKSNQFIYTNSADSGAYLDLYLAAGISGLMFFNVAPDIIEQVGYYEYMHNSISYPYLERSFVDPLLPTPDEVLLFELENGLPYPLKPGG